MLESALLSIGFPELDRGNGWPDEEGLENPALVPP